MVPVKENEKWKDRLNFPNVVYEIPQTLFHHPCSVRKFLALIIGVQWFRSPSKRDCPARRTSHTTAVV